MVDILAPFCAVGASGATSSIFLTQSTVFKENQVKFEATHKIYLDWIIKRLVTFGIKRELRSQWSLPTPRRHISTRTNGE